MAATRIKVPQLANGTDGELITWDASGVPTTVAVGTSGQVLTSNGVGAAPTFQTSGSGNGIYGGSGTIFPIAVATVTANSSFTIDYNNSQYAIIVNDDAEGKGTYIASGDGLNEIRYLDSGLGIESNLTASVNNGITFSNPVITAGDQVGSNLTFIQTLGTFKPNSGTDLFTEFKVKPTINQTGGASGASIGIEVVPTLTAVGSGGFTGIKVTATSQTALHTTAGKVKFDLGSDANYDMFYRGTSGELIRLPIGSTSGHVLTTNGTGAAPTWQAAPVAEATTASNGLNLSTLDVRLGGSLTSVTTITGDTTNYLTVTGTRTAADAGSLVVNNTGSSGPALKTLASGTGAGVWGESTTGTGVYGSSGSISVGGYSTGTVGTLFTMEPASTNTIAQGMVLDRNTTGTATDGIGNKIFFRHETSTSANQSANSIVSKWSTATHASRLSEISFTGYNIGTENTLLSLLGTGKATLNKYGAGTFTSGTAVYALQVDASGNIMEGTLGGGGGVSDADYGDITVSGTGTVWTIDALAVTNGKINDVSVAKLTSGTVVASLTETITASSTRQIKYSAGETGFIVNDTNNSISIFSKSGSQAVTVDNTSSNIFHGTTKTEFVSGVMRIWDSNLTNYVGIQPPSTASLSSNYTLTLPDTAGSANQVLTTDGTGVLTWSSAGNVNYAAKTANYTITATDNVIDCTANSFTVTLPTAVGLTGKQYSIKNSASGQSIIVDPNGAETIDGGATYTILFRESITICSTGANWIII